MSGRDVSRPREIGHLTAIWGKRRPHGGSRATPQTLTKRKRAKAGGPRKRFLRLYQAAVAATDTAPTVSDALQAVLKLVCAHTGWPVGHAYLGVNAGLETLVSSKIWHCAAPARFATFRRATEAAPVPTDRGLAGRVLLSGRAAWSLDAARILAAVDAYSAIPDDRPYKKARSHAEAMLELRRGAGTRYDPHIVEVFCQVVGWAKDGKERVS